MNIIERIKEIVNSFPNISDFTSGARIDFTSNQIGDVALYSMGDSLLRKDILDTEHRRHNFVLYATNQSINDYERLANSSFLLELGYWLEKVKGGEVEVTIQGETRTGTVEKMSASNAMIFSVPTGDVNDGVTYQIQIYAEYVLKGE